MRQAAKRDANEPQIIEALKRAGFSVVQISQEGVPDLLVSKNDDLWMVEVKMPKGKLTAAQEKFFAEWEGKPITIVHSEEEALMALGAM